MRGRDALDLLRAARLAETAAARIGAARAADASRPDVNTERIRHDFDEIARLADARRSGRDRFDSFLLSLVPDAAVDVLDVGCGLGRLCTGLAARAHRRVTGIDLSYAMIERARAADPGSATIAYVCADFLTWDVAPRQFDCVLSAATLHHMPVDRAIARIRALLRPGGRIIIHDVRSDAGIRDRLRTVAAFGYDVGYRLLTTGRLLESRALRAAWRRHGRTETYLTLAGAEQLARRLLPGARVYNHWLWRYTIVWDEPNRATS
jgi:SAM-dependent methyltransferase